MKRTFNVNKSRICRTLEALGPAESSTRRSNPCSSPEVRPPVKQKVLIRTMIYNISRLSRSARHNETDFESIIPNERKKLIARGILSAAMNGDRVACVVEKVNAQG